MKTLAMLSIAVAACCAATVHAADPAVSAPQPVVLQPAPVPSRGEGQSGMSNYNMTGMTAEQQAGMAQTVKRQNMQLGHGMGGMGPAKGAKAGKAAKAGKGVTAGKKAHKKPVRKQKHKRKARHARR